MRGVHPPYLQTIHTLWNTDQPKAAGMAIFERIPRELRPRWAADSLRFAMSVVHPAFSAPDAAIINAVLTFADQRLPLPTLDPAAADTAHTVFDRTRSYVLAHAQEHDTTQHWCFHLTENVAKVSYNAYGFPRPFDHDAGWWVAIDLYQFAKSLSNATIAARALDCLTAPQYLQLTQPIRCNPDCSTCAWLATFEESV